ncbi:MAG: transposase [Acidobacteriaceae bacterium]|nr:transposase [Acidobacteriaceae bacterium]
MVAKAERNRRQRKLTLRGHLAGAANRPAGKLYEELYCARGDMKNRIKEHDSLFAGRASAATLGLGRGSGAHHRAQGLDLWT